uniref:Uncharacterized protein n=1 Tax=Gopherus evgoodei TaxID=1825980 RepID=A0A8C4VL72_9SAUR
MMRRGCADPITPSNPLSFFLQVKPQLEEKEKKTYPVFEATNYRISTQCSMEEVGDLAKYPVIIGCLGPKGPVCSFC